MGLFFILHTQKKGKKLSERKYHQSSASHILLSKEKLYSCNYIKQKKKYHVCNLQDIFIFSMILYNSACYFISYISHSSQHDNHHTTTVALRALAVIDVPSGLCHFRNLKLLCVRRRPENNSFTQGPRICGTRVSPQKEYPLSPPNK